MRDSTPTNTHFHIGRPRWCKRALLTALLLVGVLPVSQVVGNDLSSTAVKVTPVRIVSRLAGEVAPSAVCPTLPGCPNGPSIPLPPFLPQEPGLKANPPTVDVANLLEGTGKYAGMVLIPSGPFEMGSNEGSGRYDERPVHQVFVKNFYIAKKEITVKEYCDFLNAHGEKSQDGWPRIKLSSPFCPIEKNGRYYQPKPAMGDKPVVCVSWYGAADYAKWAGGRLPTSSEWEKAALLSTPYQPGDYLTLLARADSVPVSIAAPGVRGITGMIGNVWEWCSDWYAEDYYANSPVSDPTGPPLGKEKIVRGGSWASPEACKRIRNVHKAFPRGYFRTVGFRIAKD